MWEEVTEFHCILRTEHKRCYKGLDLGVEERVREVYSFWPEATEKWGTHLLLSLIHISEPTRPKR